MLLDDVLEERKVCLDRHDYLRKYVSDKLINWFAENPNQSCQLFINDVVSQLNITTFSMLYNVMSFMYDWLTQQGFEVTVKPRHHGMIFDVNVKRLPTI